MKKAKFVVISEYGLHARPATKLIKIAATFKSDIFLTALGRTVNFKSIMGVISLGVCNGEIIEISASGIDEDQAIEKISDAIVSDGLGRVEYE